MQALIERLKAQGIRLEVQGGSLRVHTSKGALTPEIREMLRKHSAELARELRSLDGEALTVEELTDLIRGELKARPFPIAISPAESIVDVELFARGEARMLRSGCPLAAEAAKARLRRLGITGRGLEG